VAHVCVCGGGGGREIVFYYRLDYIASDGRNVDESERRKWSRSGRDTVLEFEWGN
jgi:hypothetical protein